MRASRPRGLVLWCGRPACPSSRRPWLGALYDRPHWAGLRRLRLASIGTSRSHALSGLRPSLSHDTQGGAALALGYRITPVPGYEQAATRVRPWHLSTRLEPRTRAPPADRNAVVFDSPGRSAAEPWVGEHQNLPSAPTGRDRDSRPSPLTAPHGSASTGTSRSHALSGLRPSLSHDTQGGAALALGYRITRVPGYERRRREFGRGTSQYDSNLARGRRPPTAMRSYSTAHRIPWVGERPYWTILQRNAFQRVRDSFSHVFRAERECVR